MEGERKDTVNQLLLHGCSLARDLESNLENSTVNPHPMILSYDCDEIIRVFSMARDKLNSMHPAPPPDHHHLPKEVTDEMCIKRRGNGRSVSAPRPSNPRRSLSRDEDEKMRRWVRVAAPLLGNTEVSPEDGFSWRKYGQKDILNTKHPRSYYRCTHQKLYSCPAKKQVQRLDDDPSTLEILYRGEHTCHMSLPASSAPPPPSKAVQDLMILPHHPISSVDLPMFDWVPLDIPRLHGEGASSVFEPDDHNALFLVTSCSSALGSSGAPVGSSTMDGEYFIHDHQNTGLDFDLVGHAMDDDDQFGE